ncbi:hypothetical protein A0U40_18670 [[Bacillus] sp. KCTC 13219]|nr:hypothetical protein A0U40_18670 [[Bacillus] sp. KCTC 13219]
MINAIEETKPAHLDYRLKQESSDNYVYVGAAAVSGEGITIYPWTPKEIELRTTTTLAGTTQSHEILTIYPKGEGG